MKLSAILYLIVDLSFAFPASVRDEPSDRARLKSLGKQAVEQLQSNANSSTGNTPPFSPTLQRVDVSGIHEWKAPGPNDERGPCPGLNALANHGYLPRNGLASIFDLIGATGVVYGMGIDLSTILSAYGAVLDGVILGWSIGGQVHTGISGSHNNYETDASPTRGDLHQYGSNVDVVLSQFKELYDMQPDPSTANYNIDILGDFKKKRFHESVEKNPLFFYGPFSGVAVTGAAFAFIYRYMANHTAEQPDGILDREVLKSFFSISGPDSNLTWTRGHERIPENWYRRHPSAPYGLIELAGDIGTFSKKAPEAASPGCNMGKVNTFENIQTANFNLSNYDIFNPIDTVCLAVSGAVAVGDLVPIVGGVVEELLLPIQNVLNCPTVPKADLSVGKACPGYSFYGGPQADIAPGAIQS